MQIENAETIIYKNTINIITALSRILLLHSIKICDVRIKSRKNPNQNQTKNKTFQGSKF